MTTYPPTHQPNRDPQLGFFSFFLSLFLLFEMHIKVQRCS